MGDEANGRCGGTARRRRRWRVEVEKAARKGQKIERGQVVERVLCVAAWLERGRLLREMGRC